MHNLTRLNFPNLQRGWEGINEYLYLEQGKIASLDGGYQGSEMLSFNNYVVMDEAWVDPEFDFGITLGYSLQKWTALVNNYVDFNYLDLLRATVSERVGKKARMYNYTYHFDNSHGSGKDCLVAITITKRPYQEKPILVFQIRTSEVTKRLLFDFLLVQRIGEYIYGHNNFEVHLFAPSFYITAESFLMYNNVRPIMKMLKKHIRDSEGGGHKFHIKVKAKFKEFMDHPDPWSVMFRVNRRSMLQIQKGKDGLPISGVKSMKAKTLKLRLDVEPLPKKIKTPSDLRQHKKKNR